MEPSRLLCERKKKIWLCFSVQRLYCPAETGRILWRLAKRPLAGWEVGTIQPQRLHSPSRNTLWNIFLMALLLRRDWMHRKDLGYEMVWGKCLESDIHLRSYQYIGGGVFLATNKASEGYIQPLLTPDEGRFPMLILLIFPTSRSPLSFSALYRSTRNILHTFLLITAGPAYKLIFFLKQ